MFDVLRVFFATLGVVAFVIIVLYATRYLTKRVSVRLGSNIRVLDRISFGRDSGLMVVSVCGSLCLIGVSATHTEMLKELDISEAEYLLYKQNGGGRRGGELRSDNTDAADMNGSPVKNTDSDGDVGSFADRADKFPTFAEFLGKIIKSKNDENADKRKF